MKRLIISLLLSWLFVSTASAESTVFIVRHAEKAESNTPDPELTEDGHARARRLEKMLIDTGVTAIYATEFKRTQQTAAPLARALGLAVTSLHSKDIATLSSKLRHLKGNALVVAHRHTIPHLINALGIAKPIKIHESDYDDLFVVTLDHKSRLILLHYP